MNWLKKLSLCFLIVVLVILLWTVSRWMMADLAIRQSITQIESWNQNQAVESLEQWQNNLNNVKSAIQLNPDESEYYRLLGLSYEWKRFVLKSAEDDTVSEELRLSIYKEALKPYRKAVELRPSWPQAWVKLVRMKTLVGEFDNELKNAFLNALSLGGNDRDIQLEVSQLALIAWPLVNSSSELELAFYTNFYRGLSNGGHITRHIQLLTSTQTLGLICKEINIDTIDERAQRACTRAIQ